MLYLDVDRFKHINDTFGHPCGDALLAAIAARLRASTRDIDIAARFGGDEFVVLHSGTPQTAISLGDRLVRALGAPYQIDRETIMIGTSIGISCAPEDGSDADQLFQRADLALRRAKHEGRRGFYTYSSELSRAGFLQIDRQLNLKW